jgi:hypothetical protein
MAPGALLPRFASPGHCHDDGMNENPSAPRARFCYITVLAAYGHRAAQVGVITE